MHLIELLHKKFENKLPGVHKVRLKSLMGVCEAAVSNNKLYLTGLGRAMSNSNKECSNIQKVDRLLGNGILQAERDSFYKVMILEIIQENPAPVIYIDWTCINPVTNLYALRASASMPGRSIVIYEACYPKSKENNHATHKEFLDKLKTLLPQAVKPIIVTDAGFRALWFAYILQLGWDFVGRLRNKNTVHMEDATSYCLSSTYFEKATTKPKYLGFGRLTQANQVPAHFVLYKGKAKNRISLTLNKKRRRNSGKAKKYSKTHKDPWLLVSSLQQALSKPKSIINLYQQRMRIEENIRDTKCPHYGLGLKKSLTQTPQRMNILLLIAAIASFAAWLAGLFTKSIGNAADFQAQSAKFTRALSYVFLGNRVLKTKLFILQEQFEEALAMLYQASVTAQLEVHQNG